jgi:hypothetical protein
MLFPNRVNPISPTMSIFSVQEYAVGVTVRHFIGWILLIKRIRDRETTFDSTTNHQPANPNSINQPFLSTLEKEISHAFSTKPRLPVEK